MSGSSLQNIQQLSIWHYSKPKSLLEPRNYKVLSVKSLLFGGESQHETTQLDNKTLADEVRTILRGQKMETSSSHCI